MGRSGFSSWIRGIYSGANRSKILHGLNEFHYWFNNQLNWTKDEDGNIVVDHIMRFENLDTEWRNLSQRIGFHGDLRHDNETDHKHYRAYYDDFTRDLVARHFSDDIAYFGYEF